MTNENHLCYYEKSQIDINPLSAEYCFVYVNDVTWTQIASTSHSIWVTRRHQVLCAQEVDPNKNNNVSYVLHHF